MKQISLRPCRKHHFFVPSDVDFISTKNGNWYSCKLTWKCVSCGQLNQEIIPTKNGTYEEVSAMIEEAIKSGFVRSIPF